MKIGTLTLFKRMHSNGKPAKSILVAAWHWKWSLTWSWVLNWHPDWKYGKSLYFIRLNGYRYQGLYFHTGIKIPFIGHLSFQNQPTMQK